MSMRSSSLANNPLAITRELDGRYDVVLQVRDNLDLIEQVAGVDFEAIIAELEAAQDFTGITVVQGETVAWDAVNKVLTVPKGDKGDKGNTGLTGPQGLQGIQGPQGIKGDTGLKGDTGSQGPKGFTGDNGPVGPAGVDGENLTVEQISYNGDGSFTWQFSDGTSYITPNLRGPKGDTGLPGVKGDQGISVHHIKGTSTTDSEGDFATFGEIDTYTVYGDAAETINLGYFRVNNGAAKEEQYSTMYASTYDTNANGIVDNSERLGGVLASDVFNEIDSKFDKTGGLVSGDVTITGDLVVNGDTVTVNTETVTAKDNLILINSGEVGHGITAGVAGIEVDRGLEDNYKFMFVESDESFKIGTDTTLQKVATREDTPLDTGIAVWNATDSRFEATRNIDLDVLSFMGNGTISWNTDETTLDIALGTATLQVGQETLVKVRAGSAIGNGKVVMATGSLGNSGRVVVGLHDGTRANGKRILGISTQDIANGTDGFVTAFGKVRNINTTGSDVGETWVDGDILYVKPGDSGNLTKVVPTDTQLSMPVAFVVHSHTNGTLFVRVTGIDENAVKDWMQVKLDAHTSRVDNPHNVTKAQLGLGNVDNTSDINKNVLSASKLTTSRTINGVSFDGSANITVNTPNSEVIKFDTGVTEGTDLYTFNGSAAKTINIKAGTNVTLTKATGSVTINANDTSIAVTEITGMGAGASTFLATPTSTNLAAMLTDETGTGAVVFANSPTLTGTPLATTAVVGTNTTQVATTAFVNAEIANDTYSKTQLDGGQLDNRYYTEAEIDAKLGAQNDASEINYSNTVSGLVATKVQGAVDEVEGRLDIAETKIANANISRADKYLASQNIANMIYTNGDLTKIRYKVNTDTDYETLSYTNGNLTTINHYVLSVLKGSTTLSYSGGNLVSAIFVAV